MLLEDLGQGPQSGLGRKIGGHMSGQQDRGAHVDDVERLHHMLLFALQIGRNGRGVLKIELPMLHGLGPLLRVAQHRQLMEDASMLTQDPVDGTRRTGQAHPRLLETLIARQIVQDRASALACTPVFRRAGRGSRGCDR
jgi:hypothetical protein